jgi:hypothetical protein
MVFCCHCGKLAEGGRFCTACGRPIAPTPATATAAAASPVEAMKAELDRHHKQMRLVVAALGLALAVSVGLIIGWVMHAGWTASHSLSGGEISVPALQQRPPLPIQTPSAQVIIPDTSGLQTQQQAPQVPVPGASNPANQPPAGRIDPKQVEKALTALTPPAKQSASSDKQSALPTQPQEAPSEAPSGSDRYPGSKPVEIKDANLPDIGIPVAGEVYSTSDSIPTVISYYTQRYPDAQVMEISGQKIIAVSRPGVTKVIAIGTTGEETQIAIVQPR